MRLGRLVLPCLPCAGATHALDALGGGEPHVCPVGLALYCPKQGRAQFRAAERIRS
ncbi:hypothetical protein PR003_g13169 [Phytophthora rubi]|uniref:Uncharacterized protein n=1 Tax=Phytophthora rubi TaxID=129364 RepID=A0A6A4FI88_9STRA|nr:hypothetical protein PR002_g12620 [Phytophthora rubi]KAE9025643.1 hypothetical protein PR001_g12375 [Phytophthora rubi]KAE9335120.1 hypothetical protein PR003_g13169 [Phytophthora rubi]